MISSPVTSPRLTACSSASSTAPFLHQRAEQPDLRTAVDGRRGVLTGTGGYCTCCFAFFVIEDNRGVGG